MTREQAMAYMNANIGRLCAEQGISVEITDPELIALSVRLLSIGRRNEDSLRLKVATTPTGR